MSQQPPDVADRLAIQDVMARYARYIDERELDLFRALFDDAVELDGFGSEPLVGPDAWLAFVESTLARFGRTQHMLGPVLSEVEGDRARARTDLQAIHVHAPPDSGVFTLWGTYHTELTRDGAGWRIVRHRLAVTHVQG
jgi:3-phenylpropionate/cinnamic acid dioxygenase small subunit